MNTLKDLQELVTEINSTNSTNEKMVILSNYPQCKDILKIIYNEMIIFGVTSDNVKKLGNVEFIHNDLSLFELLDKLSTRELTGHTAVGYIKAFIINNIHYVDLIYKILDKDLQIGMGVSNINKVFKNLVPTFDVALANSYQDVVDKINIEEYYASRKLDGLRCICIKKDDDVRFYSRKGKEFLTLDKVKEEVLKIDKDSFVLDGELCIVDEKGNEDFKGITKVYNKKDFTIPNPKYKIFDYLYVEAFESKEGLIKLSDRYEYLLDLIPKDNPILEVVEQVPMNEESFIEMQKEASDKGWEGLILRRNVGYKGKRSNDILKVKKFYDDEYVVKSIDTGLFQVVIDGVRQEIETLTAVHIEHKGFDVKVGSGFTLEQRQYYYSNPNELIGKIITVQYFEETNNDKGGVSLRFPTLKIIHGDTREV